MRACHKRECDQVMDLVQARIPGARITVELRNDCGRALDIFEAPAAVDEPPPNASHHHLDTGERRKVEIDSAMRLMLRDENGDLGGSIASDVPGAVFLFFGPDCRWSIVDTPAKPLE